MESFARDFLGALFDIAVLICYFLGGVFIVTGALYGVVALIDLFVAIFYS